MSSPSAGYVRVSRDLFEDTAFKDEPYSEREAFLWLIMEASFKAREKRVGSVVIKLDRGQVGTSTRFAAGAWGWSEARVRRYFDRLKNRRMITCDADAGVTVVTLCNYDKYQSDACVADAQATQRSTHRRRTGDANENKDEIREEIGSDDPISLPRGKREVRAAKEADFKAEFAKVYEAYPRKVGRADAERAWVKARTSTDFEVIADPLREFIRRARGDPDIPVPHFATWLNKQRWHDDQSHTSNARGGGNGRTEQPGSSKTQRVIGAVVTDLLGAGGAGMAGRPDQDPSGRVPLPDLRRGA